MPILLYIIIGIAIVVLIFAGLFYLAKGLLFLLCCFLRLIPTIIKTIAIWAIVALVCSMLQTINKMPTLPGKVYLLLYFLILGFVLVRRFDKYGSIFKTSEGTYKSYVLNAKSKVIHEKYSDSERTISSHHKIELSDSEARELVNKNNKYRFKER